MCTAAPDSTGRTTRERLGDGPFAVLRDDLQRSRIVCNTLDALFRRREELCPVPEALSIRDFVASDLCGIYEMWCVDIIPLIERVGKTDRETQSLVMTLRSELSASRTMAMDLATALDLYCAHPTEAAMRSIGERVARFCPSHRSLADWLQSPVLYWLAKRLDAPVRKALAEAVARRQDEDTAPISEP